MGFKARARTIEPRRTRARELTTRGPFDLAFQNQHFHGWPALGGDDGIAMAFPVEGSWSSAGVAVRQRDGGVIAGDVVGDHPDAAWRQAIAALSLDVDGAGWPAVAERDPVIGALMRRYRFMRPSLFHSPYEAAAHFIIGHRIRMSQAHALRRRIATRYGAAIEVAGETHHAFPSPETLLALREIDGLPATKLERLHAACRGAADGWLTRAHLRSLEPERALEQLQTLPGLGPFFAQGILYRGAGIHDGVTRDRLTSHGIQTLYQLEGAPPQRQLDAITERWRPYRMWCVVLVHVWIRETGAMPRRSRATRDPR